MPYSCHTRFKDNFTNPKLDKGCGHLEKLKYGIFTGIRVIPEYYLGMCYLQGNSVHLDAKKAVYWFQKSAKQGYGSAQFVLGILLFKGIGITKNYAEAYAWLDIATINSDIKLAKQYRNVVYSSMTQAQSKEGEKLAKQYLKKYVIPYFE